MATTQTAAVQDPIVHDVIRKSDEMYNFIQPPVDPAQLYRTMQIVIGWAIIILDGKMTISNRAAYNVWRGSSEDKILSETGQTTVWRRGEPLINYLALMRCPLPLIDRGDGTIPRNDGQKCPPCASHYFPTGQTPYHSQSLNMFTKYLFGEFLETAVNDTLMTQSIGQLSMNVFRLATQMRLNIPENFRIQATLLHDDPELFGEWVKATVTQRKTSQ